MNIKVSRQQRSGRAAEREREREPTTPPSPPLHASGKEKEALHNTVAPPKVEGGGETRRGKWRKA